MGILYWILFGLVAGVVAKFIMPNGKATGWIMTILLGIAGSFVGGFLGSLLFGVEIGAGFNLQSFGVAVAGAVLLLFIFGKMKK